jgi:hypothetical protein
MGRDLRLGIATCHLQALVINHHIIDQLIKLVIQHFMFFKEAQVAVVALPGHFALGNGRTHSTPRLMTMSTVTKPAVRHQRRNFPKISIHLKRV